MIARLHAGISLWTIFERDLDLFRRKDRADICARLLVAGSHDSCPALITPPDRDQSLEQSNEYQSTYAATTGLDQHHSEAAPAPQAHGGLSAGAMRRVREYVDVHLSESIDLAMLAAVAGLSVHHFAREFKQSVGVPPHHYLTQKRVERAQEMLAQTELSLSEIAYAAGFSDQSHLARHFRHMLGTTPREFRWSQR